MSTAANYRVRTLRLPNGLQLEFAEQGAPGDTTVLLLHGSTDSWRSFEALLPLLPAHWHVIAPSQRGHGRSDKTATDYGTRAFAADAAALARQLGLPPLVVVGHSMGAANALRLVIDQPDLVRGLVAVSAFASFADKPDLVAFHASQIEPLTDPVPYTLAHEFQHSTVAGTVDRGWMHSMVAESLQLPARVWRGMFAGLLQDDFSTELPRVQVPTLLAWGERDAYVPRTDQQRLLAALPRARLLAYPGVGHALHWEQPEAFARDLTAFVEALAAPAPASASARPVAMADATDSRST